jgi:hypothetical protein
MLKVPVKDFCTCTANAVPTEEAGIQLLGPVKHNYNEHPIFFNEPIFSFPLATIFNKIDIFYDSEF